MELQGFTAPTEAKQLIQRGIQLRNQGALHWAEAEDIFKQAVQLFPTYDEAHYQLASIWVGSLRNRYNLPGWSFLKERTREEINIELTKVIALNPKHPGPYYCFACIACYLPESFTTIKQEYDKALILDTDRDAQYHIYHMDVAMSASEHGDRNLAVEAFKHCFETDPEYVRIHPDIEPAYTFYRIALGEFKSQNTT